MKKLLRIVGVLVALVVVGVGVLYFYRNSIVRSVVEKQSTASLGVPTKLGSANLGLFGGTLNLSDFKIGSPTGYKAEQMFTLGALDLGVSYGQLRDKPIRVNSIVLDKPVVVIEHANGKFNFQAMMDNMGGGSAKSTSKEPKTEDGKDPVKLIIDQLTVRGATVTLKAFPPLLANDFTVTVPEVKLTDIGNADGARNGAAIKDVVGAVISALASKVSTLPELKQLGDIDKLLGQQAKAVMGDISKELEIQAAQIQGQVTGQINKAIGNVGGDLGKLISGSGDVSKDINKTTSDLTKHLTGGEKEKKKEKEKK
ncbi:MAG TPA: AsmA family protein [Tepidisphaeraceae bacterium]|nr:AsmA family protein [Tepidisphaeraceae bacterium]